MTTPPDLRPGDVVRSVFASPFLEARVVVLDASNPKAVHVRQFLPMNVMSEGVVPASALRIIARGQPS